MSQAPLRKCNAPGCRALVRESYCAKHKRVDAPRKKTAERGYNSRWQRASKTYLAEHPLCVECERKGRVTAAQCVDHIIPHRGDWEKFWNSDNWQALCASCHSVKTSRGK